MNNMKALLTCSLLLGTAVVAQAGTVGGDPVCVAGTFSDYVQLLTPCAVGSVALSNFELYTLSETGVRGDASAMLSGINVTPSWNAASGIMTLLIGGENGGGFLPYSVDATHTAAWEIRFTVDPPPIIQGEDVALDPPFGVISGTQRYCRDAMFTSEGCSSEGTLTFDIPTAASVTFASPLMILDTLTTIRLNPDYANANGVASGFDGIIFTIHTTPEPGTWLLATTSLALAGFRRRKR